MYSDDDLLMLSGIQHIAFCERQWALIYIEQQWSENLLTIEGHYLHEKVDDPFFSETRKDIVYLRSLPVVSYRLGLYGKADLVELCKVTGESENAIEFPGRVGKWKITPVEYKRGKPKTDTCDEVQLCAQALCFEEMYNIKIIEGYIYYGQTRHRYPVEFNTELRNSVFCFAERMHELFRKGKTPVPVLQKGCKSCSIYDLCMPDSLCNAQSVNEYLKQLSQ